MNFRWTVGWLLFWSAMTLASPRPVVTLRQVVGVLSQPVAVTAGPDGQVLALDAEGKLVRWTRKGNTEVLPDPGLKQPLGLIHTEAGWLVADTGHQRIVLIGDTGKVLRSYALPPLTCPDQGPLPVESCQPGMSIPPDPSGLAVIDHLIYWSDRRNHKICRMDGRSGTFLDCWGERGRMEGQFQYPYQMAVDPDHYLHVVDILNARIQVFDKQGQYFSQSGRFGLEAGELYRPVGIALDGERGLMFVSDGYFGTITVFHHGRPLGILKDSRNQPVVFDTPSSLCYRDGKLWVAETGASRIVRLDLSFSEERHSAVTQPLVSLSQKNCLLCHLEFATEAPFDIRKPDELGQLPVASFRMCYSCHQGPVIDSRPIIRAGNQHPTLYDPPDKKEKNPWPRDDDLPDDFPITREHQLTCTSCHTPHTNVAGTRTLYEGHHNAWLRVPNPQGRLCERCHESKAKDARSRDPARRGVNHPLGLKLTKPPRPGTPGYPSDPELSHGLPKILAGQGGMLDPEGRMICQSCHQIHGGRTDNVLLLDDRRGQLCAACHKRQFSRSRDEARRKGVHPVNIEPEEEMKRDGKKVKWVTCGSCHPVHDGRVGTPMLLRPAERLCQDCHRRQHARNKEAALEKGVHPVNMDLDEPVTLGDRKIERLNCLTCHAVHQGKPGTPALVEDHHDGQLCRHCHEDNIPVLGSDHDLRVTAGDSRNRFDEPPEESGVCGACHSLHRSDGASPFLSALKTVGTPGHPVPDGEISKSRRDQFCLNCHQDHRDAVGREKTVKYFSHPSESIVLHSSKDTMPLLDKEDNVQTFGAIACTTCHDPHVWRPEHLRPGPSTPLAANTDNLEGTPHDSFLREVKPEKTFCLGCHGLQTREKYKYFHDDIVRAVVDYLE